MFFHYLLKLFPTLPDPSLISGVYKAVVIIQNGGDNALCITMSQSRGPQSENILSIYSRLCLKRTLMGLDNLSTKDRGPLNTESVV